jgi:hypothetical protein
VACFDFWREICHPAFSDFCNTIGTKPKWWNVRFCAAVEGQADIKRASSDSADL